MSLKRHLKFSKNLNFHNNFRAGIPLWRERERGDWSGAQPDRGGGPCQSIIFLWPQLRRIQIIILWKLLPRHWLSATQRSPATETFLQWNISTVILILNGTQWSDLTRSVQVRLIIYDGFHWCMMSCKSPVVRSQAGRLTSLVMVKQRSPLSLPSLPSLVVIKQVWRLVTPAKLSPGPGWIITPTLPWSLSWILASIIKC